MSAKTVVSCVPKNLLESSVYESPLNICMVGTALITCLAQRKNHQLFVTLLKDIEKALASQEAVNVLVKLLREYHEFATLFFWEEFNKLPSHCPYDHTIPLLSDKESLKGLLYNMSRDELLVLQKYLKKHLFKSFIQVSSSSAAFSVIFVKKPEGGLCLCVDYRGLNNLTVKNHYPLPLIRETLNLLTSSVIFTKLDIIAAFNKLQMAEGKEWKTAMRTCYSLFEYLVMLFELCEASSSFQSYINDILWDCLDIFVTAYIDDILIYSKNRKDHQIHVQTVLTKLQNTGLQLDIDKCKFNVKEVKYLGLIITKGEIRMNSAKVTAIANWEFSTCVKNVQSFLGFANFYWRFIKRFSQLASPLTALTQKDIKFDWSSAAEQAFQALKAAFTSALILVMFDLNKLSTVESDSSDCVTEGVLSQSDSQRVLHSVIYFSTCMSPAECNYDIYNKKLLAIIHAFEE